MAEILYGRAFLNGKSIARKNMPENVKIIEISNLIPSKKAKRVFEKLRLL